MTPIVNIVEQPATKSFRFRYISENRLNGSIEGANTTSTNRSYPKIEISNYTGDAEIIISCVSDTKPFYSHPHKLTSEKGGCYQHRETITGSKIIEYKDICILFTKKNDIVASLTERKKKNVDPLKAGWNHMQSPQSINLDAVRLCFQVIFFNTNGKRAFTILTDAIKNKKKSGAPKIHEISSTKSCISGGEQIMLFCGKVQKDDIRVVFYDESSNWKCELTAIKVHHQYGISFRTPPFNDIGVYARKLVLLKLYRPSDQESSDSISFEYYVRSENSTQLIHKSRPKRHDNITPDTIPERGACMNPTKNDPNDENRRIDLNAILMRSIELKIPRAQEKSIKVEQEDDYTRLEWLLRPSTSKSQSANNLDNNVQMNAIPNPQSIITNHQPYSNTDDVHRYPNPSTYPTRYTSVPTNTPAPAFATTNISNFPHLNENQSDQISMHSLSAIDSTDLINFDEHDVDYMSILDNISTSLEKIQM